MVSPESFFHVAIKTEDLGASVDFYREQLGADLLDRVQNGEAGGAEAVDYAALRVGDKRVYLFDRAPYEAAGVVEELPPGVLHFGYVVDDVEAAAAELANAGVDFFVDPMVFGNLKIAFFTDPGGVRVELIEHLDA